MNSEALQPEASDVPTQDAQLSTDERLTAVTREAVVANETTAPLQAEDAGDIEAVDEPSADDVDTEAVQPEEDAEGQLEGSEESSEDVEEATEVGTPWDGDPSTVPDELKAGFDKMSGTMNKALQKKFREVDAVKKQYEAEVFKYRQAQRQQPEASGPEKVGPPKPPGEGATAQDWESHEARTAEYYYKKFNAGTTQDVAVMKQQNDMQNRLQLIVSQPGASDEVMYKMRDMAESDPRYIEMYQSDDGAVRFFEEAKFALEKEAFAKEKNDVASSKAEAAKAAATRKADASKRSTGRPGSVKAASTPEETFSRKTFRNYEEKLAYIGKQVLDENGL